MLSYQNVSISYDKDILSLKDFTLDVGDNEIVALVGESGSGKTTALRGAIGLLPGNGKVIEGDIQFNGESLLNLSQKKWNTLRGKEISLIFQDSGAMLNPIRTIGSQFIEYIRTHEKTSKREAGEKAKNVLKRMGLPHNDVIMKSYPFQLSGGMRQRVGISMAMAFQPKLLLADEPTSALDVTTQAQIVKEMLELQKKYDTSILLVTHNLGVAAYMADKIIVMLNGEIVDSGNQEEIIHNPRHEYTQKLLEAIPDMRRKRYV